MTSNKRRAKRISVELPVTVYLFDNKGKTRIGDPLAGRINNFSPLGAALSVPAIMITGSISSIPVMTILTSCLSWYLSFVIPRKKL